MRGFDIVANEVAVRSGATTDPFTLKLTQGVLDTNVEDLLMSTSGRAKNVAELFSRAGGSESQWLTLRAANDESWKGAEITPNVRARVAGDLSSGAVVVAPRKLAMLNGHYTYGWWRVDPRTGDCLGMGPRGWGSSSVEYFIAIALATIFIEAIVCTVENISDNPTAGERARMLTCLTSAMFCEVALMIAIFMILNPELAIPATYYLVAEETGAILATTVVIEGSAIPIIGHVSAEACGMGLAIQSLGALAGGGEGEHGTAGAGHGPEGSGTGPQGGGAAGGGQGPEGGGQGGPSGGTGAESTHHGRIPPLEDDPHHPGKLLPPWSDMG